MRMFSYLKRVPPEAIARCTANAQFATHYIASEPPGTETLCLKESWDGLHFIMSPLRRRPAKELDTMIVWNNSDLLAMSILGKDVLNPGCKISFGVPKWINSEHTLEIAEALSALEWLDLADEIVPENMARCGVYPEGLWDDELKAAKFLKYWYLRLTAFYNTAASNKQAVISFMKL